MKSSIQPSPKKLLFVLYQFPPSNDVGAQRPMRFIRNLKNFGWQPWVLAPSNGVYNSYAADMLEAIRKDCTIIRTPMLFPAADNTALVPSPPNRATALFWRIWNRLAIPDGGLAWLPKAVRTGIDIVRKEDIPVIVASGQPFSTFVIGAKIASATGAGLVLDYRDPWTPNPFFKGSIFRRTPSRLLEGSVLEKAAAAVFTTDEARRLYAKQFARIGSKCHTITNSFEPMDPSSSTAASAQFRLVHAGNFYGSRNPVHLFQAVAKAIRTHKKLAEDLKISFFGIYSAGKYQHLCQQLGIDNLVEFFPRIPRSEIYTHLRSASLLLLINSYGSGHEVFIPSKFFEYLSFRKPILCLSEKGALASIVDNTGAGTVVDPQDENAIADRLIDLYQRLHIDKEGFCFDENRIGLYESKRTTETLVSILDASAVV